MDLRPLTTAEVPVVADLWYRGWRLGHLGVVPEALSIHRTPETFEARLRDRLDAAYVAGPSAAPSGFVRIIGDELDQFYVEPEAVGRGQGRALMAAAETRMQALGIVRGWLWCSVGNDRAAGFYAAMGWEHCGVHRAGVETQAGPFELDVIRFEKTL